MQPEDHQYHVGSAQHLLVIDRSRATGVRETEVVADLAQLDVAGHAGLPVITLVSRGDEWVGLSADDAERLGYLLLRVAVMARSGQV